MNSFNKSLSKNYWRHTLLAIIVFGSLAIILSMNKFGQDPSYHYFADRRACCRVPNFLDVVSNLPFLLVGIFGILYCLKNDLGGVRVPWLCFFVGVALVCVGSGYYHWAPGNDRLVWDRLPMTVGFMGLFAALLGEHVGERLGRVLLFPALLLGMFSVLYWFLFDDLRFYIWIQLVPLLTIPTVLALFHGKYSHSWMLLAAFGCYALAKVFELFDKDVFALTGFIVSGHTIKHLLAALGTFAVLLMLLKRRSL